MANFSLAKLVSIALTTFALTLSLHGCGDAEKCPDMVPIANGKVKMKCERDGACEEEEVKCDSGCGYGVKAEDVNKQMQFSINTLDNCVIKFTKEPPYCHKCENNGDSIKVDGASLTMKEGAKAGSACGVMKFTCDDGKKGDLSNGVEYDCVESFKTEAPCIFDINFLDHNPCSNKTKVKSAKVKDVPSASTEGDTAKAATDGAGNEKANKAGNQQASKDGDPKQGAFVEIEETIVSDDQTTAARAHVQNLEATEHAADARVHNRKHADRAVEAHQHHRANDEDLPILDQVRPWVLDAHAAAYRERH